MARARIGILGAGYWAAYHYLPFFRDHPDVDLVGVVRKTEGGLEEFRRCFGLEIATTSVEELLAAGLDGVVVSSPHSLHREHAVAALEAGAHVLVEKPMAVLVSDARATVEAARRVGRPVSVAHGWNYSRMAVWAKEQLDQGAIGEVTSINGFMASSLTDMFSGAAGWGVIDIGGFAVEAEADTWARANAGGGYLYGQLSHLIGLAGWLVPSEPEEVFARARFLPNGVDLDVHTSVRFADGLIASFAGHGRQPWIVRHACELRIAGNAGVLTLDFERERADVLLQGDKEQGEVIRRQPEPPPGDGDGGYSCDGPPQLLVDRCLGREAVDCAPGEVGVRSVAIMEAAWRSATLGGAVAVTDL